MPPGGTRWKRSPVYRRPSRSCYYMATSLLSLVVIFSSSHETNNDRCIRSRRLTQD
ncbi:unnamed protein product, partial [Nesidiocoris tenuis]